MTKDASVLDHVLGAATLSELDGAKGKQPKRVYLIYARKIHPDLYQNDEDRAKANKAFAHLGVMRDRADGKMTPTPGASTAFKSKIKTKRHEYDLGDLLRESDVFLKYEATYDGGHQTADLAILKSVTDTDLGEAHVRALKKLKDAPEKYRIYFPELMESIRYRNKTTSTEHIITATVENEGFRPMSDILRVYPDGIGGRDVAWIFRRMLVAIGNAHDLGIINGAPTLDAFLVHDVMHGVILADWEYSVESGSPLVAVPKKYKHLYPTYALDQQPVDYRVDIHIAATMAASLLKESEPTQLTAFFKGCKINSVPKADQVLEEFDQLLDRLYGKRTFHEFSLTTEKEK